MYSDSMAPVSPVAASSMSGRTGVPVASAVGAAWWCLLAWVGAVPLLAGACCTCCTLSARGVLDGTSAPMELQIAGHADCTSLSETARLLAQLHVSGGEEPTADNTVVATVCMADCPPGNRGRGPPRGGETWVGKCGRANAQSASPTVQHLIKVSSSMMLTQRAAQMPCGEVGGRGRPSGFHASRQCQQRCGLLWQPWETPSQAAMRKGRSLGRAARQA